MLNQRQVYICSNNNKDKAEEISLKNNSGLDLHQTLLSPKQRVCRIFFFKSNEIQSKNLFITYIKKTREDCTCLRFLQKEQL